METNTERFEAGHEAGLHGLMAWNAEDAAWLAGWIRGNEKREERAIAQHRAAQARAQAHA
jgi:hypothetical protein